MIVAIGMLYTSQLYFGTVDVGQGVRCTGRLQSRKESVEETDELEFS